MVEEMVEEIIVQSGNKQLCVVHKSNTGRTVSEMECQKRVIRLVGRGSSVTIDEIFTGGSGQSIISVVHEAQDTRSYINTRGVVQKNQWVKSEATVIVPKNIKNVKSRLVQRFLLLEKTARAQAIPSFEIEENEVQASHAATIAPINEDVLFYLMARGFPHEEARQMVIDGFLQMPGAK